MCYSHVHFSQFFWNASFSWLHEHHVKSQKAWWPWSGSKQTEMRTWADFSSNTRSKHFFKNTIFNNLLSVYRDLLEHLNQKRNHISRLLGIPLNNVKRLTSNLANSTADPFSCQVTFSNSQSIISCLTAKPITAEVSWSSLNKIYCHNLWL